ncbi:hypothetical protein DBT_0496 [Dissulfuribacter thermophilus]|uniref:Uncharacterized protein n=1 Tax=Dissulfuribacter thermophilus TaxID=1156395 RepID=A0A1B9F857_9BACT|nr:hypothetical protein [Dissulfuribacter thermophilus]OCC16034.1 hypothetical protein DBT_0496 [Dissulfuribacter thermophilus]
MQCLKNPNRPTQPAICANCRRKCEKAGKNRRYQTFLKAALTKNEKASGQ